ncbi:ribosome biogenesis GTPase Lsg1 [Trichuris trichiura]|uniref:Large subunit GTPase 1 homolog n=1 Tax=Trichuris trichiura TaxID=36087 RepID=A0A077ZA42_TRITR|nr:ribosome biogenesis GTPase Lsg1 [Trichuris trichiura]
MKASQRRRVRRIGKVETVEPVLPSTAGQLRSVTQETNLDEFFSKAEMRGRDFAAEKLDPKVIFTSVSLPPENVALHPLSKDELSKRLRMPRRPNWQLAATSEELSLLEQNAFMEWRKDLEDLQENSGCILTPFEKNLDIWRQLWRVMERSDIVVQLVDARNPLIFRVPDLEVAVKELCPDKVVFLLLSKADLLTSKQRQYWADYFTERGDLFAFWSNSDKRTEDTVSKDVVEENAEPDMLKNGTASTNEETAKAAEERVTLPTTILEAAELLTILKRLRQDLDTSRKPIVIGMVGYPNVGKSSTINKILGAKRVAVSATPGKTKHLQTLVVDREVTLCDAPGLVFPAAHFSLEHMLLAGMLSSDYLTDYMAPIRFLCDALPYRAFERHYGIIFGNSSHVDSGNHVDPHVLLTALAFVRGFMSTKGIPDRSRAARYIIKDCTSGRLPYCVAPPGIDEAVFNADEPVDKASTPLTETAGKLRSLSILEKRNLIETKSSAEDFDAMYFCGHTSAAHVLSRKEKPVMERRKQQKHSKREKLRRVFAHLDA